MGQPALKLSVIAGGMPACRPRQFNAVRHGAFSRAPATPYDDPRELQQVRQEFFAFYKPVGAPAEAVVDELVVLEIRRLRLHRAELDIVSQAVEQAQADFPQDLLEVHAEVHAQELELGILDRLLNDVADAYDCDDIEPATLRLRACAPLFDGLLGLKKSVGTTDVEDGSVTIASAIDARRTALVASRATLAKVLDANRAAVNAALARAALLDDKLAENLRKERVSIERSTERRLGMLQRIQADEEVEGVVVEKHVFRKRQAAVRMIGGDGLTLAAGSDDDRGFA